MDPFIGEIRIFGGNFAPRGWAFCDGQLISIAANSALFSILGCTYGGDCRTTFGLPDLRDRAPLGEGRGPGMHDYRLGQRGGSTAVTLTNSEIPQHRHEAHGTRGNAAPALGTLADPQNAFPSTSSIADLRPYVGAPAQTTMESSMLSYTGGSQSHNNMQPYLVMNYIIALFGIYPSRS